MKKLLSIISICLTAIFLTGCAVNKQSWNENHLFQRLVLKTKTGSGFKMVPITAWENYRELDHRVGGDTLIQYCSTKRK